MRSAKRTLIPDLIATIRGRDDLAPLVENPMMLTAVCVLYDSGGRLPEDRYELYKRIVNNVLFIVVTPVTPARGSRCCGGSRRSPLECTPANRASRRG